MVQRWLRVKGSIYWKLLFLINTICVTTSIALSTNRILDKNIIDAVRSDVRTPIPSGLDSINTSIYPSENDNNEIHDVEKGKNGEVSMIKTEDGKHIDKSDTVSEYKQSGGFWDFLYPIFFDDSTNEAEQPVTVVNESTDESSSKSRGKSSDKSSDESSDKSSDGSSDEASDISSDESIDESSDEFRTEFSPLVRDSEQPQNLSQPPVDKMASTDKCQISGECTKLENDGENVEYDVSNNILHNPPPVVVSASTHAKHDNADFISDTNEPVVVGEIQKDNGGTLDVIPHTANTSLDRIKANDISNTNTGTFLLPVNKHEIMDEQKKMSTAGLSAAEGNIRYNNDNDNMAVVIDSKENTNHNNSVVDSINDLVDDDGADEGHHFYANDKTKVTAEMVDNAFHALQQLLNDDYTEKIETEKSRTNTQTIQPGQVYGRPTSNRTCVSSIPSHPNFVEGPDCRDVIDCVSQPALRSKTLTAVCDLISLLQSSHKHENCSCEFCNSLKGLRSYNMMSDFVKEKPITLTVLRNASEKDIHKDRRTAALLKTMQINLVDDEVSVKTLLSISKCEVNKFFGRTLIQEIVINGLIQSIRGIMFKDMWKMQIRDRDPSMVVDRLGNNIMHLGVLSGIPSTLIAISNALAIHPKYIVKMLDGKNVMSMKPRDSLYLLEPSIRCTMYQFLKQLYSSNNMYLRFTNEKYRTKKNYKPSWTFT